MRKLRLPLSSLLGCAFVLFFASSSAPAQTTAPNEWTWVGGSGSVTCTTSGGVVNCPAQPGVYGALGTPAAGNIPGARDSAVTWTDSSGAFWLFGGEGFDANANFGELNDLWEFHPSTKEWTWMGGSSTVPAKCAGSSTENCGQPGVYGAIETPSTLNFPGGRYSATQWTDSSGDFWLFGGVGFDAAGNFGTLGDLWEFNPTNKEWTWVSGSSAVSGSCFGGEVVGYNCTGEPGVYGNLGVSASGNMPGGRWEPTSWADAGGQFWIYGGQGFDSQGNYGKLNDLWEFSPTTNHWTWMGGNSTLPAVCESQGLFTSLCGWPPVYGALGQAGPSIGPESRVAAANWLDSNGNLWLFGGVGSAYWEERDFSGIDQYDLWELSPSTMQWAWMSGNSTSICNEDDASTWCAQNGIYGTQGIPSIANLPPSRHHANTWIDATGNLWLFGGYQESTTSANSDESTSPFCNDVWVYNPSTNEWAWMNGNAQELAEYGNNCYFTPGSWGALGTPAAGNIPSGRYGAASWTDHSGNLWIFGGLGFGWIGLGYSVDLNDLWVYDPVPPAPTPSFELIASPNPVNVGAIGNSAPAAPSATTTVSVVAADGFDSPVTLTAASDTSDNTHTITGSFNPATVTGTGSSTLTISVSGPAERSTIDPTPLTITATGGGVSQSIQVIVELTTIDVDNQLIPGPSFSIPAGTYSSPQTVTISGNAYTSGGQYTYYTTDGTTPAASSPVYVNPITVASTTTLKAIVIDPAFYQSGVSSANYIIATPPAIPTFSVSPGTYASAQTVTISDATSGTTIYYTTNGSTPTTGSTVYSGPITVSSTETIEAIATAGGGSTSAVATATYTIDLPSFSIMGTPVNVAPGATTGNTSTITLTPSGGFTGGAALTASVASSPAGAQYPPTLSFGSTSPVNITGATGGAATLTITTTAATIGALSYPKRPGVPWYPAGGAALACLLLFGRPTRRSKWRTMSGMLAFFIALTGGVMACGGGGNGGGGSGGGIAGTTAGTYTITVTGASGATTAIGTVSLTVQ